MVSGSTRRGSRLAPPIAVGDARERPAEMNAALPKAREPWSFLGLLELGRTVSAGEGVRRADAVARWLPTRYGATRPCTNAASGMVRDWLAPLDPAQAIPACVDCACAFGYDLTLF